MLRRDVIPLVKYIVDDAGCGRRIGADINAIVRDGNDFKYPSRILYFEDNFAIAVHSYLDVYLTDEEVVDLSIEYLNEIGDVQHSWHNIVGIL